MRIEDLEKQMELNKASDELGMEDTSEFLRNDTARVVKTKMEEGKQFKQLIDLRLVFPFNPINPTDPTCNLVRTWKSPYSNSSTIDLIKQEVRKNPELKEFWNKKQGAEGVVDWDGEIGVYDAVEFKFWRGFTEILHYHNMIYNSTLSGFGKYGRKFLANVEYDNKGLIVKSDLAYKLHLIETAIARKECAEIEEKGKSEGKTAKDIKEYTDARMDKVAISNPYKYGTMRLTEFTTNKDGEILDENAKKAGIFNSYAKYSSCNRDLLNKLASNLGVKSDKHMDYLEVDLSYPTAIAGTDESQKALSIYQGRTENFNSVSPVNEQIQDFDIKYRAYRDQGDFFQATVMLRSVYNYRAIDDQLLLTYFKGDFTANKQRFIDAEISEQFKEVLSLLGDEVTNTMMNSVMEGKDLPSAVDVEYKNKTEVTESEIIDEVINNPDAVSDFLNH